MQHESRHDEDTDAERGVLQSLGEGESVDEVVLEGIVCLHGYETGTESHDGAGTDACQVSCDTAARQVSGCDDSKCQKYDADECDETRKRG